MGDLLATIIVFSLAERLGKLAQFELRKNSDEYLVIVVVKTFGAGLPHTTAEVYQSDF